jgi:hypothetical protein
LPETKNGTKRDIPLSVKAREALIRRGVKNKGKVFGYTSEGLKSTWRFMNLKLGIKNLHFHDLRHEAISRLFELGSLDMMEIAAISGHKSLSMLKRYTHLKAGRLVKKLEGHRSKGKQAVMDHLIPYPAIIDDSCGEIRVRILDFEDVTGLGACHGSAIQVAQDALLRRILQMMRSSQPIPSPDQYLEQIDESRVVMIDPLGGNLV